MVNRFLTLILNYIFWEPSRWLIRISVRFRINPRGFTSFLNLTLHFLQKLSRFLKKDHLRILHFYLLWGDQKEIPRFLRSTIIRISSSSFPLKGIFSLHRLFYHFLQFRALVFNFSIFFQIPKFLWKGWLRCQKLLVLIGVWEVFPFIPHMSQESLEPHK